jgi:hypothetical protein
MVRVGLVEARLAPRVPGLKHENPELECAHY